ncbi:hypothetical protein P8452_42053 [Trifolium repens]|nr:hypothetical protein P8452_42053 [Trifolium repens]
MSCKFLLDEHEMQLSNSKDLEHGKKDCHLEKANAVIDIMSSALSLVFQINETDHINILKMYDILFSQLCLRVPPATAPSFGDDVQHDRNLNLTSEESNRKSGYPINYHPDHETASEETCSSPRRAIVPMQLIARIPAALLYWPLIQLAGAATDDIALGVASNNKKLLENPYLQTCGIIQLINDLGIDL